MFYAHFVLAKKGPLARIWLAAHWDKKLTKAHVFETNIEKSVDGILQPKVKMALRTSGHLLLGVVRIYSRKAKYLLADCNEAFVKIKMAFRPGMVDLPEDIREAAFSTITFPEVFHDFDTPIADLNDVDIQAGFALNQSRAEEITLREDYGNIPLVTGDDGFGDMNFEEPPELMRAPTEIDQSLEEANLIFRDANALDREKENSANKDQESRLSVTGGSVTLDLEAPIRDDGFGGNLGQDMISGGLFEGGLFADENIGDGPSLRNDIDRNRPDDSDDDAGDLDRFGGPPSVGPPSSNEAYPHSPDDKPDNADIEDGLLHNQQPGTKEPEDGLAQDQTTLVQNEEESFALAPVDASALKAGWPRAKRKRKLIVDEVKNISGEEMKAQLSDTTDIVTTLSLAPPTRGLMHWKEIGGIEKLFALPGRAIHPKSLGNFYQRYLTSEPSQNEDFGMAGDRETENLSLDQVRETDDVDMHLPPPPPPPTRTRGRPPKRKQPEPDFDELLNSRRELIQQSEPTIENSNDQEEPPLIEDRRISESNEEMAALSESMDPCKGNAEKQKTTDIKEPAHLDNLDYDEPPRVPSPMMDGGPRSVHSEHPATPPRQDDEDEQGDDETYEEFEERVVNKRAGLMFHGIKKKLKNRTMVFSEMLDQNNRKQVAQKFYTLLVLKKLQAVEIVQGKSFSEMTISKGALFESAAL